MAGLWFGLNPSAADAGPLLHPMQDLKASQTIDAGDPLVWDSMNTNWQVRLLVADDITDVYNEGGGIAGILGFAPQDMQTDASGYLTTKTSAVSLAGGVKPIYQAPALNFFEPTNPVSGRARTSVISCKNYIYGYLWETTAIDQALIGTAVGLYPSTISGNTAMWYWSTAATTKIGRIVGYDEQNPLFYKTATANVLNTTHNPRCPVLIRMYPTYDQWETIYAYTDIT